MRHEIPTCIPPVLPNSLRAQATALLHSQCWLWGCDVRHQPNLLTELGLSRISFPRGTGPTRYESIGDAEVVGLWGWGIVYGRGDHAVLLQRYAFEPRLVDPAAINAAWFSDDLRAKDLTTEGARCIARAQALGAVEWIISYEERLLSLAGPAYRCESLARWAHSTMTVEELHQSWSTLATEIRQLPVVVGSVGQ